ncbi:MAG: phosphoribosylamine--glycine ligase [Muribaculaceae bacterium]|nr:phosphoribosylamine--glycine ligase [Muribaculaceae bacterium]
MNKLNILLLGSGGRECALAWKMAQSPRLNHLFIAPGNPGTAAYGTNLSVNPMDFEAVARASVDHDIHLVVVGSEDPLVAGIADYFHSTPAVQHVLVVGPSRAAAQLEGSKAFAKQFMLRHNIPTAQHITITQATRDEGLKFLAAQHPPYVLKASGLAAGKGVLIVDTLDEARTQLLDMLNGKFGSAGNEVVIEQFLTGEECSVFVVTDGRDWRLLPVAKDYKRVGEGNTGLNTGGMGSISPVPMADAEFMRKVRDRIIQPTIDGLQQEQLPYCGFIFFGLMNMGGAPYVIEYNVRLGDPETQSVLPRLRTDLVSLLEASATGRLGQMDVSEDPRASATVIVTAGGYPEAYRKGDIITGTDQVDGSLVFQAGTRTEGGTLLTNGGRVLAVTSLAATPAAALAMTYANVGRIHFDGCYHRRDIGQ